MSWSDDVVAIWGYCCCDTDLPAGEKDYPNFETSRLSSPFEGLSKKVPFLELGTFQVAEFLVCTLLIFALNSSSAQSSPSGVLTSPRDI